MSSEELSVDDTILAAAGDVTAAAGLAAGTDTDNAQRLAPGERVGRYVVLERVGEGGMGAVYAAHDPELARKVALKLLHTRAARRGTQALGRLRREAQVMAQLSHPNVITVFDVGEHHGRVFLAMEFVRGQTLESWAAPGRSWRELVAVFSRAGRGLAAAHDKGLAHRDFKPQNVMIGDDDRVRVMDFGLATEVSSAPARGELGERPSLHTTSQTVDLTATGALMGTPAYMSPEQWRGEPADARSDQFSFCVALWEALYRRSPFAGETLMELSTNVVEGARREPREARGPSWLRAAVERGMAARPEDRWPSMLALLTALERGQARARVRLTVIALVAVALAATTAYVAWSLRRAAQTRACQLERAEVDQVWSDEARAAVRESALGTELSFAAETADTAITWLDRQAQALAEARTRRCAAQAFDRSWDAELDASARWCLDERLIELARTVDELTRADRAVVTQAVRVVSELPRVDVCLDRAWLQRHVRPPPDKLARARAVRSRLLSGASHVSARGLEDTRARLDRAVADAEAIEWDPLIARGLLHRSRALLTESEFKLAEADLERAYFLAARYGAWPLAAEIANDLTSLVGVTLARHEEGKRWAAHAGVALVMGEEEHSLRAAAHLSGVGTVRQIAGEHALASDALERARALYETLLGPEHPAVARTLSNLAVVKLALNELDVAESLLTRALTIQEETLGRDHPTVARALTNLAIVQRTTGRPLEAKSSYERALAIMTRNPGDESGRAGLLNNLAVVHRDLGDAEQERALLEQALEIRERILDADHPDIAQSLGNLALNAITRGDYPRAIALHERSVEIRTRSLGPDHPHVGYTLTDLADALLRAGESDRAAETASRAVALLEAQRAKPDGTATARFVLARALWHEPAERARAAALAERARAALQSAQGDHSRALAAIEAWQAERALASADDPTGSSD